jgi:hypothetical protein
MYKLNHEEDGGFAKIYRFSQVELEIVSESKGLA